MARATKRVYGYRREGDALIRKNGKLLAGIATPEELQVRFGDDELWERFKKAGGADWHTGYSWSCVKAEALQIILERKSAS